MSECSDIDFEASLYGSDFDYSLSKEVDRESEDDYVIASPPKKRKRGCQAKQKKTSKQMNRRGERPRKKTKRYGTRESTVNFNDMFKSIEANATANADVETDDCIETRSECSRVQISDNSDQTHSECPTVDIDDDDAVEMRAECSRIEIDEHSQLQNNSQFSELCKMVSILTQTIKSLENKFDCSLAVVQKQVSRIEVKLNSKRESIDPDTIELEYVSQLTNMGFPLKDVQGLDHIEEKLKDTSYENTLVSNTFSSIN